MRNIGSAGEAAGLKARTAENHTRLLEAPFLVHRLPAWGRTLRARAVATPMVPVIDPGLAARRLRLTHEELARRDGALVAMEVRAGSCRTTRDITGLHAIPDVSLAGEGQQDPG